MRMLYRNISKSDLFELIQEGEEIEDYPNDFPYPSKLVFKLVNGRAIHSVVAMDFESKTLIIVTVYEPDQNHFESDLKTRKKV